MCGIVGIVAKTSGGFYKPEADLFDEMLYLDGVRGMDSTGVFSVSFKNRVDVLKQASNPGIFNTMKSFHKFKEELPKSGKIVIGHNRKATSGDISSVNAHPFDSGGIVLVHNGYIANADAIDKTVEVDSQSIITALKEEKEPVKAIAKLFGAFAIVWYNHGNKKLYLARNSDRPLSIMHTERHMFIASEREMLEYLFTRNKLTASGAPIELTPNKVYEVATDPFGLEGFDVPTYTSGPRWRWSGADTSGGHTFSEEVNDVPPNTDELATCEFELEDKTDPLDERVGDITPGTELERARAKGARIAAEAAFGADSDTESKVKDLIRRYPYNSYVLFDPSNVSCEGTATAGYVTMVGEAWVPGRTKAVATATIHRRDDHEELYLHSAEAGVPLLAKVEAAARRNGDIKLMLSDVRKPSAVMKDIMGTRLSHEEWKMICKFLACDVCAVVTKAEEIDFTEVKIDADSREYNITCQRCVDEKSRPGIKRGEN